MSLLGLLRADVSRQHHFAGSSRTQFTNWDVLKALLSPRFVPVAQYRLAYWCASHHLRPFGKLFSLANFVLFGLEIGLDCEIGPGLYFPHTSGTVIGAKRIGANAVIYHNVTVGAKTPDLSYDAELRPEIGNDAFLGAGAKILGPIVLEDGVVVAANCVVVGSVPANCMVAGIPGKARSRKPSPGPGAHEADPHKVIAE
jgi:serine O-acetyltransferase